MRSMFFRIFIFLLFVVVFSKNSYAQFGAAGIAYDIPIEGSGIKEGNIISFSNDNVYVLSEIDNVNSVVGVVTENPAVSFKTENSIGTYPVVSSGTSIVLVNGEGGDIQIRDQVVVSSTPGIGMKSKDGVTTVVGTALEPFKAVTPESQGLILVSLDIGFGNGSSEAAVEQFPQETERAGFKENLMDLFTFSAMGAKEKPSEAFKQIVAGVVLIISIVFSFLTFGRLAKNGIIAFGRNPLAAKLIGIGMALNVVIAVTIVSAGLLVSYLILRF